MATSVGVPVEESVEDETENDTSDATSATESMGSCDDEIEISFASVEDTTCGKRSKKKGKEEEEDYGEIELLDEDGNSIKDAKKSEDSNVINNDNGKRVMKQDDKVPVPKRPCPETKLTVFPTDPKKLKRYTKENLKMLCKERGLVEHGKKDDLVERLLSF